MRHASIPAGIGLVVELADVVAYYIIGGAKLRPTWYAISIPLEAIPASGSGLRRAVYRDEDALH
jgi:hypothetical protein